MGRHSAPDNDAPTEILELAGNELPPRGAGMPPWAEHLATKHPIPPQARPWAERSWAATGLENAFGPDAPFDPLTNLAMGVPAIPGNGEAMRPVRPSYVHPSATYVPIELATDHTPRRRRPGRAVLTLIGVAAGTAVAAAGLALAADDPEPQEPPRPALSSVAPRPAPTPPPPEDDVLGMEIIWTKTR